MSTPLPPLLPWQERLVESLLRGEPFLRVDGCRSGKTLMVKHLEQRLRERTNPAGRAVKLTLRGLKVDHVFSEEAQPGDCVATSDGHVGVVLLPHQPIQPIRGLRATTLVIDDWMETPPPLPTS